MLVWESNVSLILFCLLELVSLPRFPNNAFLSWEFFVVLPFCVYINVFSHGYARDLVNTFDVKIHISLQFWEISNYNNYNLYMSSFSFLSSLFGEVLFPLRVCSRSLFMKAWAKCRKHPPANNVHFTVFCFALWNISSISSI